MQSPYFIVQLESLRNNYSITAREESGDKHLPKVDVLSIITI